MLASQAQDYSARFSLAQVQVQMQVQMHWAAGTVPVPRVPWHGQQGYEARCISWHLPDLTNGDFQGTASANTPLTSSDRNLIAGYHGVGYNITAQNGRAFSGPAVLVFGGRMRGGACLD